MYLFSLMGSLRYADATALAILLFAVIMVITIVYRTLFREDPDA
jgi:ABC-type sugar transport system permease subunit